MNKIVRNILIGTGIIIACFALFVYFSFFGTPWEKLSTETKLTTYLEEKYELKLKHKKNTFNFKDGTYGATYETEDGIEFKAEIRGENNYYDYYPEAVWKKQLTEEVADDVSRLFPVTDYITLDGVYGISNDLNVSKEIKNYKEVDSIFFIHIRLKENWSEEAEKEEIEQLFKLIKLLQEKQIENVAINLYFTEEENSKVTHGITIPHDLVPKITKKEDLKKFIIK